jgi:Winged helix DNA-binding domain
VTLRELNRATLARQLLLVRARASVPRAIERTGGIQAQDHRAPYDALFARLEGFRREALDRALERRLVVKATLMRGTLHLVSARDYPPFVAALRPSLRRAHRRAGFDEPPPDVDALAERALAFASEPRTYGELQDHLGGEAAWFHVRFHAGFVHVPPFERRPHVVAANAWLGASAVDEEEAVAYLVRRYLAAFGPATARDAARWAGTPVATTRAALERVPTVDVGDGFLDLARSPRPGNVSAPPRLLPVWESVLLAHEDRARILPQDAPPFVFENRTFAVDGVVAGIWRVAGETLTLSPFAPVPRAHRRELEEEARRAAAFHGATRVRFG